MPKELEAKIEAMERDLHNTIRKQAWGDLLIKIVELDLEAMKQNRETQIDIDTIQKIIKKLHEELN